MERDWSRTISTSRGIDRWAIAFAELPDTRMRMVRSTMVQSRYAREGLLEACGFIFEL
jgi:hypothetical protein